MKEDIGPKWIDEGYYFIPQAAELLDIGHQSLREWCHQGLIRHHQGSTRKIQVCAADIDLIRVQAAQSSQRVSVEIVRRLRAMGKIGVSQRKTTPFPRNTIPRDVAFGLIQEAMREALAEHGMLQGSANIIVGNAASKLESLCDTYLAPDDDEN